MTRESSLKKRIRARMKETGEKFTQARRAVLAEDEAAFEREQDRPDHSGDRNIGEDQ